MFDVLNQTKRLILVAPEVGRIAPRGDKLAATVFLVDDVAAQIAQRCFQHVENKFGAGCSAGRASAKFGAKLMLMFRFGKIAQHVGRRAEENQPAAFVEQDRLVKHLEQLRARLVNRDDDDFVVRHAANDLDDVLGVFRGEA